MHLAIAFVLAVVQFLNDRGLVLASRSQISYNDNYQYDVSEDASSYRTPDRHGSNGGQYNEADSLQGRTFPSEYDPNFNRDFNAYYQDSPIHALAYESPESSRQALTIDYEGEGSPRTPRADDYHAQEVAQWRFAQDYLPDICLDDWHQRVIDGDRQAQSILYEFQQYQARNQAPPSTPRPQRVRARAGALPIRQPNFNNEDFNEEDFYFNQKSL